MINSDSQSLAPICLPSICKHGRVFCSHWARVWHRTVQQQGTNSSKTRAGFYVCLSACTSSPRPAGFGVKKVFGGWRARSPSPLIMAGCAAGLTPLLTRAALRAVSWPLLQAPGVRLVSRRALHPNKDTHLGLSQHWFSKSKWRGEMSSEATALSFPPWLNLRAKFNNIPVFSSVFSFAISFPLQRWTNGRRGPAAEEKKKKSLFISNSWSHSLCTQIKFLNGKYIPVIDITWTWNLVSSSSK